MRGATDVDIAAGLLRLEDRREYDEAFIAAAAGHAGPDVRRRAALAAGRIRDRRGIPALGRLLGDADTAVAAAAAFGLGQMGDTAAVPLLAPYVSADRIARAPTVVGEAAYAIAKLQHPQARAALERLLREAEEGPGAREAVGSALLGIWRQGRPLPVDAISPWLQADDAELRWRAAYSLARRADPRGTAALFPAAGDADPLVRSFVARSLTKAMADSAGIPADEALSALLQMVRAPEQPVRINAIRSLGTYEHVRSVFALNDLVTQTRDPHAAITAAESLQRLGTKAVYGSSGLRTVATDARRPVFLRTTALIALADVVPHEALEIADAFARESGWR
ncbi:MAG TPA: HEAT repeat domain-containing protein, partial [Longimicrobium sp.]|nr:HEAT repeat domain-containing protein [Longimicrobium sp.]